MAVRRPPLALAVPSGDRQLPGTFNATLCAVGRRSGAICGTPLRPRLLRVRGRRRWRVAGSRYGSKRRAQHSSGTTLRASPRGFALLGARPPATPWALNSQKSSIFAHRRSPRGRFERRLAVGSHLARLGATTCALQRPSGANSALPQLCLLGLKSAACVQRRWGWLFQ